MPVQKSLTELKELHREFLALATSVEELVAEAVRTIQEPYPDGPVPRVEVEPRVERARQIVERCRRIVLLYQPVAIDFREVTAILRVAGELEHIGNRAAEIIERSAALAAHPLPIPEELSRMAEAVSGTVRRFVDAYTLLDEGPVQSVDRIRVGVNRLAEVLTQWLVEVMRTEPALVEPGLNLFAVVQNLQRIAEHATTLAEEVAFLTQPASTRPGAEHPVTTAGEPVRASSAA
jgi:phosphate transport system protein